MNQLYVDPLRFLKPRKRQSQLTPKKYSNQPDSSLIHNQNDKQKQNKDQQTNNIQFLKTSKQIKSSYSSKTDPNLKNKKTNYNPQKYFSKDIELHLLKLQQNQDFDNRHQLKQNQNNYDKNKQINNIDQSFKLQPHLIIPLSKGNDHNDTLNLEDYFSSKQTPRNFKENNHFLAMITQSPIPSKMQKNYVPQNRNENIQSYFPKQQIIQEVQQENQLKQCPTCHRKFNPNSYSKHIKVCQKVFFNKRKQFASQKQRSLSKQKRK